MSTFDGIVDEFPGIRIDYFRAIPGRPHPKVHFLSHVHSDHLQGLERPGGPFIYCSPATREILLRLEKHPHQINFHKGILESRKPTYKHLTKLVKTIPLNTPTEIELDPTRSMRVTLLDANHCIGAVMFLIQDDSKAILYTGDVRSEPIWVDSLISNPVVLPFCSPHGPKRLAKIYLDTTFATKEEVHRNFPTKAAGLKELIGKVKPYPEDTIFHFNAWTFGYEDVWKMLANYFGSQVHVEDYTSRLYKSLRFVDGKNPCPEGSTFFGFPCGNKDQAGCLTDDDDVRLHSCKHGMTCSTLEEANVVHITPILSYSANGGIIGEVGAGGGGEDLVQIQDFKLSDKIIELFKDWCKDKIADREQRRTTLGHIAQIEASKLGSVPLTTLTADYPGEFDLIKILERLAELAKRSEVTRMISEEGATRTKPDSDEGLPKNIVFPYSRHSSYEELCHLVEEFKPLDVYPCTVDENTWDWDVSVENLFGNLCSAKIFAHDVEMMKQAASRKRDLEQITNRMIMQGTTSSREESGEPRLSRNVQVDHKDALRSSDCNPRHRACDSFEDIDGPSKRRRISPTSTGFDKAAIGLDDAGQSSTRLKKLQETKSSFEGYQQRSKMTGKLPARNGATSASKNLLGASNRDSCSSLFQPAPEGARSSTAALPQGTQAEPIELYDGDTSSTEDSIADEDAGDFLLDAMPEPDSLPRATDGTPSGPDTQLSLSDAAFESQSSCHPGDTSRAAKLQRRQAAYEAARKQNGLWETDHGLVSSFAGHGDAELEL